MRAQSRHELCAYPGSRINSFHSSRIANRHMDQARRGVEEGGVRNAGDLPLLGYLPRDNIEFHKCALITGHIETAPGVIDIHAMRASGWKLPMRDLFQPRQVRHQDHRGIANREKHTLSRSVRHTPSRSPRKRDGILLAAIEAQNMKRRTASLVSNARDDRDAALRHKRDAIGSR